VTQKGPITASVKEDLLAAELRNFLRNQLPKVVDVVTRKTAFDITADTMKSLNGVDGLPKRIDTGRYRGAWRVALKTAGISVGGLPSSAKNNKSSDGSGSVKGSGVTRLITVTNNVEYALHVEAGTVKMRPGNHLARALIVARRNLPTDRSKESLNEEMQRAFYGGA